MGEIKRIKVDEDEICLKKGFDGWRVVFPYRNADGTINLKNLIFGGSVWKIITPIFICLVVLFVTLAYSHDLKACSEAANYAAEHPCEFCLTVTKVQSKNTTIPFNLSALQTIFQNAT